MQDESMRPVGGDEGEEGVEEGNPLLVLGFERLEVPRGLEGELDVPTGREPAYSNDLCSKSTDGLPDGLGECFLATGEQLVILG